MPEPVTHAKLTEIAEKFGHEDAQTLTVLGIQSVAYVLVDIREELTALRKEVRAERTGYGPGTIRNP